MVGKAQGEWQGSTDLTPFIDTFKGIARMFARQGADLLTEVAQGSAVVQTVTKRAACGGGV